MPPRRAALPVLFARLTAAAHADPARIDEVVAQSFRAQHRWPGRGVAPRGYLLGLLVAICANVWLK